MLRVPVRRQWAAPATLVVFVVLISSIYHRALSARDRAAADSAAATRIEASYAAVPQRAGGQPDSVATQSGFRDAVVFHNRVYLCRPTGIYSYDSEGLLRESYESGRELPAGQIAALAATAGELVAATSGAGLLVFDGTRFRQLLPADAHLRTFTSVLALNTGRVLLGTPDRGVVAWDGRSLEEFLPQLKSTHITAMAGSDADLWIGTLAGGVWRLHAGQLDSLSSDLPDPHVLSISVSGDSAYVGTAVGVVEFREGRKTRDLAQGYFALALDADEQSLAAGTEDEGVLTIPLASGHSHGHGEGTFPMGAPVQRIFRMSGVRYALAGSLYRSDAPAETWTRVLGPGSPGQGKAALTDNNIASLNVGRDGRIWVGYFDRGLDVADPGFENVRHFEDEHLFCINRIAEEPGGARTAVATANGLVTMDPTLTVRQVLGRKDGLLADHVTDVLFRPGGMVIATPAGLSLAEPNGIRSIYVLQGLVNNHVYSLAAAGDRIAAGTLGGLSLLDRNAVTVNYTTANSGLKHNWISAMARVGEDWFAGTYGAGVMRLDLAGTWTAMTPAFDVNPNAMAQSGGALYVGSLGKGLWVYAGRWRNVTAGLPSLNVTAVAAANGLVYVGTDNGLVRFREGDLR
jgi:ligand-binding sensor domain-containing protein